MKLSVFFSIIFVFQLSAAVHSQNLSIDVKNKSVRDVLELIEAGSSYRFFYNDQLVSLNHRITIKAENKTLRELLDELLSNQLSYYKILENNMVVIAPREFIQQYQVSGKITDEEGNGLPGVNILEKGTNNGTITDLDGNYTIALGNADAVLVFSFIGYISQEIEVSGKTIVDLSMTPDISDIGEVVVVGYGTIKKANLTGSVSQVEGEELSQKPVSQVSTALQGVAPGVTIVQRTGQPGADGGSISIRGVGSLSNISGINKNAPLVLVDGVEYDIDNIDANDIESISVLKDAAASSIYGVRAGNGVILITTKRGLKDKVKVSYSNSFGWQQATRLPDFVGAQDYMRLVNLVSTNSGGGEVFSSADIAAYDNPNRDKDSYPDTYWMDEILTGNGFQQQHSFSIAGGTPKSRYRFSTNYYDQNGLVKNTDFERLTVRLNTDVDISKRFSFSADMAANLASTTEPQDEMWFQFHQAANTNPLAPVKYSDGTWGIARGDGNPVRLQEEGGLYEYDNNLITGNFKLNYKLFEGLTLSGVASANYTTAFNSKHKKQLIYTDFFTQAETVKGLNEITKESYKTWFTNFQGLANYEKTINHHYIKALIGVSRVENTVSFLQGYRRDLASPDLTEIDAGAADGQSTAGESYGYGLLSYFGRVNYSFMDKYLFEANIRRDASSRFAEDQHWGTFPSFSVGWRLSEESFMNNIDFLQELKLRASWGRLGNHEVGNYPYQSLIYLGYNYPFGGTMSSGARLTVYPNSILSWETSDMTDVGVDMSLFNGKFNVTFDYFIKNTNDILLDLPIPSTVGLDPPFQNAGSVKNTGWELSLEHNNRVFDDFSYSVRLTLSDVKNEITDLKGADWEQTDGDNRTRAYHVGEPIGAFYGYEAEGIFQSEGEITSHATQPGNIAPGDLMYKNQNPDEDNVIDADDRVMIGSDIPRYTYGINLGASYKGFDLSAFFQGVGKVDVHVLRMIKAPTSGDGNFNEIHLDSWTTSNTDASFPRLVNSAQNYVSSSFWIKSGAYLRLKNIQLGYTLPKEFTEKAGISRFRVFVGGHNLITFSKLNDYNIDPESPHDERYYPQVKIYTFGVNVNF